LATDELEEMVSRAAALAEKVQERYRDKAFELLLQSFLAGGQQPPKPPGVEEEPGAGGPKKKFTMPLALRALLSQYSVPEESVGKLFEIEGEEVVPKFLLKTDKKARAQIQLALIVAMENVLKGEKKFEFGIEMVRKRCQEHDKYDAPNFLPNFKQAKNSKLFKSFDDPEHVELTSEGKAELAQTVAELAK